jgi:hypothetical protein
MSGLTPAGCARDCVKQRDLQNPARGLHWDQQDLAEQDAGVKAGAVGTFDPKSNSIQVRSDRGIGSN